MGRCRAAHEQPEGKRKEERSSGGRKGGGDGGRNGTWSSADGRTQQRQQQQQQVHATPAQRCGDAVVDSSETKRFFAPGFLLELLGELLPVALERLDLLSEVLGAGLLLIEARERRRSMVQRAVVKGGEEERGCCWREVERQGRLTGLLPGH